VPSRVPQCRLPPTSMVQSRSHPGLPATTNRDSSPQTMDRQTLREFRAPPLLLAITLSRTTHLQDRQPPSAPNARADTHPSCPACETLIQLFQDATRHPSQVDRLTAVSSKAVATAHCQSAKNYRQTRGKPSHLSRKTFRSL